MSWQLRLQFWKSSLPPTIEDVDGKAILYALDMTTDGEDCARLALDYIYSMLQNTSMVRILLMIRERVQ